jgi:hypothetical protein
MTVGISEHLPQFGAGGHFGVSVHLGLMLEKSVDRTSDFHWPHSQAVEKRIDDPLLLAKNPQDEMLGSN